MPPDCITNGVLVTGVEDVVLLLLLLLLLLKMLPCWLSKRINPHCVTNGVLVNGVDDFAEAGVVDSAVVVAVVAVNLVVCE